MDARAKLCILSRIALHAELDPDAVATQTISTIEAVDFAYAKELGCTIRQVSRAQLDAKSKLVHARVAPMLVPLTSPIAWSHGTQKWWSRRAASAATWSSPVTARAANLRRLPSFRTYLPIAQHSVAVSLPVHRRQVTGEFLAPHYLRFVVNDKPGIVSGIAGALAKVGANIDSLLQRPGYTSTACRSSSPPSRA